MPAFLKQLSEIAHERRRHNKKQFNRKWTVRMAMTLFKYGARAAVTRAHDLDARRTTAVALLAGADDEGALLGDGAAAPFLAPEEARHQGG